MSGLPPINPIIQTHYLGPTDTKSGRVVAKNVSSGKRVVVSWDHGIGMEENHFTAAQQCLHTGWSIRSMCSVDGGGYLFSTGRDA